VALAPRSHGLWLQPRSTVHLDCSGPSLTVIDRRMWHDCGTLQATERLEGAAQVLPVSPLTCVYPTTERSAGRTSTRI
jgi:hypothetical protein